MNKKNEILEEFDVKRIIYESFGQRSLQLIKELLALNNIAIHHISFRTKDRDRLQEKIVRKGFKYSKLDDITDICGIRVITYFAKDVDKIAELISYEFKIDQENTIDKRKLAEDKFGYMSLHYVLSLPDKRTDLIEYSQFKNLKLEIQIRSVLQHGWAEIEHDLGYKGSKGIPSEFKRDFNRISALLETADKEFDRLREELSAYDEEVRKDFKSKKVELQINNLTLRKFIEENKTLNKLNKAISKYYQAKIEGEHHSIDLGALSEKIKSLEVKNIDELSNIVEDNAKEIISNLSGFLSYDKDEVISVDESVGLHTILDKITTANNGYK